MGRTSFVFYTFLFGGGGGGEGGGTGMWVCLTGRHHIEMRDKMGERIYLCITSPGRYIVPGWEKDKAWSAPYA